MCTINILDWIGYIGSVIVAVSLTMKSMIKLRWFNLIGAVIFTVYGFLIEAIPVFLVNGFIICINVYYLFALYRSKDFFQIIEVNAKDSFLSHFVIRYAKSISLDFPDYKINKQDNNTIALLILRDMAVASVFVAQKKDNSKLEIKLDYALPQYRDFKTGYYLFNQNKDIFKNYGINTLIVKPFSKKQIPYYAKMGFKADSNGMFVKNV